MLHHKRLNLPLWRRVAAFIILLAALIFAGVSVVLAQETQPSTGGSLYLPLVVDGNAATSPTPTQTTAPTATPSATPMPPTSTPSPTPSSTPSPTPAVTEERQLTAGITTSQVAVATTLQIRQYAVNAVFVASQLAATGNVVTTGTVTVIDAVNAGYAPLPNDRLRVLLPDGRFFEVIVGEIEGNPAGVDAFFNNNHRLAVQVISGPAVQNPDPALPLPLNSDLHIFSSLNNGATQLTVTGVIEQEGVGYTLNLASAGAYYFESSFGGLEQRSDFAVTGTIAGGDLALTVDERYVNEQVVANNVSVSLADAEIRNQWSYAGVNFQMVDGLIRRSFRQGLVNENELNTRWLAQGTILQNGVNVGNLSLDISRLYVDVVVNAGGQSYLFQRFRRP